MILNAGHGQKVSVGHAFYWNRYAAAPNNFFPPKLKTEAPND